MNIFWLFRSNLKNMEYYHRYDNLEDFEENCHDFYMLLPIWLLRNGFMDTAVVWRLSKIPINDIDFVVDGKQIGRASCRKECRSRWSPYH